MKLSGRKFLLLFIILFAFLYLPINGQDITPALKFKASGSINDFCLNGTDIIMCTHAGTVEVFNFESKKSKVVLQLPELKEFMGDQFYLQQDFLVYCVGLNKKGSIAAFTANEENTITLLDLSSKQEFKNLRGHQGIVTKMEFIDDHNLVTASEDGFLMLWKLE